MDGHLVEAAKRVCVEMKPLVEADKERTYRGWDDFDNEKKSAFIDIIVHYMIHSGKTMVDAYNERPTPRMCWESLSLIGKELEMRCRAEALKLANHGG